MKQTAPAVERRCWCRRHSRAIRDMPCNVVSCRLHWSKRAGGRGPVESRNGRRHGECITWYRAALLIRAMSERSERSERQTEANARTKSRSQLAACSVHANGRQDSHMPNKRGKKRGGGGGRGCQRRRSSTASKLTHHRAKTKPSINQNTKTTKTANKKRTQPSLTDNRQEEREGETPRTK